MLFHLETSDGMCGAAHTKRSRTWHPANDVEEYNRGSRGSAVDEHAVEQDSGTSMYAVEA